MSNEYYYYLAAARYGYNGEIINDMPKEFITDEFIKLYVEFSEGLEDIPEKLKTRELCDLHIKKYLTVKHPEKFKTDEDISRYFKINNKIARYLSKKQIANNNEIINYIINNHPDSFKLLPKDKITDDLMIRAIISLNLFLTD